MTNNNEWKKQFSPDIIKAAEEAVESKRQLALTSDIVLKMFFTSDMPESNFCLRKFIGAVIGRTVTKAKVTNPEILPSYLGEKSSQLDINCTIATATESMSKCNAPKKTMISEIGLCITAVNLCQVH